MPCDVDASVTLTMIYTLIPHGYKEHNISKLSLKLSNKALFLFKYFDRPTPELLSKR